MSIPALSSAANTVRRMFPSQIQIAEKFSASLQNVPNNLSKVALPAIALMVSLTITGADAGPLSYGVCVAACMSLATPVLMPACTVGCLGLAGPWCP
jgi:hypothetical protein